MDKKIKLETGLQQRTVLRKRGKYFSEAEKHLIIQELISTGSTKVQIWKKYTGQTQEHGELLRWMRKLGYDSSLKRRRHNFGANSNAMTKARLHKGITTESNDFEVLHLKNRIAELEKKLKDSEMKAVAYSTMVDIAEKQFNIPIKKKYNTKL